MRQEGAALVLAPFFCEWSAVSAFIECRGRNEARTLCVRVGRAERPRRRGRAESLGSTPSRKGGLIAMAKKAAKGGKKKGGKKR